MAATRTWWLDWSALPNRKVWASLEVNVDGTALVRDEDGNRHNFSDGQRATKWLQEDEYSPFEALLEAGEIDANSQPPEFLP